MCMGLSSDRMKAPVVAMELEGSLKSASCQCVSGGGGGGADHTIGQCTIIATASRFVLDIISCIAM